MHTRVVHCEGFLREDGDWDIEGSIIDSKPFRYTEPVRGMREPGDPVHHMVIRLTVGNDMVVRAAEAAYPATPYWTCPDSIPNFQALVGARIDYTWRARVRDALGNVRGCTHARELLFPMATVAFQTIHGWQEDDANTPPVPPREPGAKPYFLDGCLAWATDGPVVARFYPKFHTGAKKAD